MEARTASSDSCFIVSWLSLKTSIGKTHKYVRKVRDEIQDKAEYVGGRFAEEARKIHFNESPSRGIYGEASSDEVKSLAEDGVPFLPIPRVPDDMN